MYMPAKINANLARILQKYLLFPLLYFSISSFSVAQSSSQKIYQQKKEVEDSLIRAGFWEAEVIIDQVRKLDIQKGRPYYWDSIEIFVDGLPSSIPAVKDLEGKIANQFHLNEKLREYVRTNYHRNGYPLAKANLLIGTLNDNKVEARINVSPQNYILYDSLRLKGDSQIVKPSYLSQLLNLNYEQPFDIKSYQGIETEVAQLEYVRLSSTPALAFENNKAIITLALQKVKTNQFDAIIGLVPEGSQTNVTGQVDARLRNLFKRGIGMEVFWQKYSANSQFLNFSVAQSHAFKSPLGINFGFELLQEDSSFLMTDLQVGTQYPFFKSFRIGLSYQRMTNNVLRDFSDDEISNLNPLRSSRTDAVLLNLSWQNQLTYPQLRDYIATSLKFSYGYKQINNLSSLPLDWQNVPQSSVNLMGGIKLHLQKVLGKRVLIEAIPQYTAIRNPALSQNDLIRLGGLQNLRGFDRNFFYTRYFGLLNLNYRYFLDQMSSFFLLTDVAKLQSNIDWVYAAGAGVDIKSKNGWFRIIYALGSQIGNKPDFSQGKVHFGYIAVF